MMRSEFIERTGFEPTAAEYEEIEQEYLGTDIDKDKFCKEWVKNGGIQRLARLRTRRIEELEAQLQQRAMEYDELDHARAAQVSREQERRMKAEQEVNIANQTMELVKEKMRQEEARANEAERKLAILKEAFAILNGGDESPAVSDSGKEKEDGRMQEH